MDYLAAMNMEWGYVLAVEKMLGLEIPKRAEYIRIIVSELNRLASHLMFFGTYLIDLGAFSPFLYAFQEREHILKVFEEISGARLLYNYIWIGGVWNDIDAVQLEKIQSICDRLDEELKKYEILVSGNKIFQERTMGVGIIDAETCYQYGATGPVLRGAGVPWDLRKNRPYGLYGQLDFQVPYADGSSGEVGDCWSRYWVRMREMKESISIIRQCLEQMDAGPIIGKTPKVIKLPVGEIYMRTECPRGELGYHLISDGGKTPYRLKVKSSCFTHISILPEVSKGLMIADFVALVGSIDIVLGEVDR
jgi:NADH-quinone oxidoreductase subunit D